MPHADSKKLILKADLEKLITKADLEPLATKADLAEFKTSMTWRMVLIVVAYTALAWLVP